MIKQVDKILADEIIKKGLVSQDDMNKCVLETQDTDEDLRSFLVKNGFITEAQAFDLLSQGLHLQTVDVKKQQVDPDLLRRVPVRFAWYYKFLPLKLNGKVLTIACVSSLDVKVQDEIRVHLGFEPQVVLAKESDIIEALKKHYGLASDTINQIMSRAPGKTIPVQEMDGSWVEDLEKESQDASVSKLVNQIFLDAYKKRATDIHLEPYRDKVRLRYRIDGVLVDANLPPEARQFLRPMLSRIKIMANLSIEEKRLPQDGSAVVKTKDQDLDLRVSTIPTPRGESIVVRILPTKVMLYSLEKLGIAPVNLRIFRDLVKKPHGIILVTGPTGSGKTTTLYACLSAINSLEKKIITIEDPIEYEMEGVTQIQVNHKVNLDFARGLRSILRHDPDIIMVGEIRDIETAEIAIRTALTGHLVFSTLHTNDAASGVTRLIDMGLEPFLVASSIEAFVAQRLLRIICPHCRMEVTSPLLELKEEIALSMNINATDVRIFMGKGCDQCNNTGFYGRTAIYEILLVDEEIRTAILEKKRTNDIKRMAIQHGMRTLRQDGWQKVLEGVTTPEEVINVTVKDDLEDLKEMVRSLQVKKHLSANIKVLEQDLSAQKNDFDSRVYERIEDELRLRFQIVNKSDSKPSKIVTDGIEHSTYTKDISAGGLRFMLSATISVGTILALKIQLKENERSVDCMAKICRVEKDTLSGHFFIVCYYLDITSADRVKIDQYVKVRLKEKAKNSSLKDPRK
jgi:type II secretory ATPase GspE/PulE/Tfp pilus assembly ATPase PilB-like protein